MKESFNKDILIIGLGSQASAWALNLRDAGRNVSIYLRKGSKSMQAAKRLNLNFISELSEVGEYKFILLLIPDDQHTHFLKTAYDFLKDTQCIIYAHGYSVQYHLLSTKYPKLNHLLLAPKAIASEVRFNYETGAPMASVISSEFAHDDSIHNELLKLAKQIGSSEILVRSFKEETNADLFSEQSILCSLLPFGAIKVYEKLITSGISKEVAYIEAWHEVRLIANAMIKFGPKGFFELISPNAFIGGHKAKSLLLDKEFDSHLDLLMSEIENSKFFHEVESTDFQLLKNEVLTELEKHPITETFESFGKKLR